MRCSPKQSFIILVILLSPLCLITSIRSVRAQTFYVSSSAEFRQALQTSAMNGQSDSIYLADGFYNTTDDFGGTFTIIDYESNTLVIQGSSPDRVFVSGANTHQVFNFTTLADVTLRNISIIDGYSTVSPYIGGIYSKSQLNIENSRISRIGKTVVLCDGHINVSSSSIDHNMSPGLSYMINVKSANITDSVISNNVGDYHILRIPYQSKIANTIITNNTVTNPIGQIIWNIVGLTIQNSIILDNTGNLINAYTSSASGDFIITNSILDSESHLVITGNMGSRIFIYNSYLDKIKVSLPATYYSIIYGGDLGFIDRENENFHTNQESILVDGGTPSLNDIPLRLPNGNPFDHDLEGNPRISGAGIDIGPYEFQVVSATAPTITSFNSLGLLKVGKEVTFNFEASAVEGRSILQYEIDFGDGQFQLAAPTTTHIFNSPGRYNLTVKVTDNEGEYSIKKSTLEISDLSYEEKLVAEYERGQKYVIENHDQFGLMTISEMNSAVLEERNKWDANGDGKIGLEEAIEALKVIVEH